MRWALGMAQPEGSSPGLLEAGIWTPDSRKMSQKREERR